MRLNIATRNNFFGVPGKSPRLVITTPWGVRVQCHQYVAGLFIEACDEATRTHKWRPRRIDGYANRAIRGSRAPSLHGYALAWDFFATPPGVNPPGGVWTPSDGVPAAFARAFTRRGFTWGASWKRKDIPHIEWAGAPPTYRPIVVQPVKPAPEPEPEPEPRRDDPMILHIKDSPYSFFVRGVDASGELVLVALTEAEFWEIAGAGVRVASLSQKTFDKVRKGERWAS